MSPPKKIVAAAAAAVLLLGTTAYSALLVGDINAMSSFNGTQEFDAPAPPTSRSLKADVDYAVYAPGKFNLSFPGSDPSGGQRYVYAYRVHSTGTIGGPTLEKEPTYLSVGFDLGDIAQDITFLNLGNGADPVLTRFIAFDGSNPPVAPYSSATWDFQTPIPDGQYSEVVLFTSPQPPERDDSSVLGPAVNAQRTLPSPGPVPEPGSLLAACGMVAALLVRRRAMK